MERLRLALQSIFSREEVPEPESDDSESAKPDHMSREIRGSMFALAAVFELVALTSYLPLDSFSIFQGRFDYINNLGGIVGAIAAEFFLGTCGLAGYSVVGLTLWFAFLGFRGTPVKNYTARILGLVLGTFLSAISLQLLFSDKFPEASLFQGGYVGKYLGNALRSYFNTTGSILVIVGGYILTLILTTGFSFTRTATNLFGEDEKDEEDNSNDEETVGEVVIAKPVALKKKAAAPAPAAKPKKPRSRKKKSDELIAIDEDNADAAAAVAPDEEDTGEAVAAAAEEGAEEAPAESTEFVFEELKPFVGSYSLPSTRLLKNGGGGSKLSRGQIKENAQKLTEHLLSFQITGDVVDVQQGPVLTTYEYKPSAGVKLSKIAALQDDLGVVLGTRELRIIAPIPGKTVVGIEVPKPQREVIGFKDIVTDKGFYDKKIKIPIVLGKSTDGIPLIGDLTAMPHLLVAGSTGSGKSVFINSLIMSMLYRLSPQELRMILVDPKMLEFSVFDGLPHLLTNVITNNGIAYNALNWAVLEMDRRYKLMAQSNSKNIDSYNSKQRGDKKFPYIVIVVDELADLMMSGGQLVEVAITRLAQKARAAGIHLVIATQRPSTDVVTGLIKANIPSRIAFKVTSGIDSRTILDTGGAEELIGKGDSLMMQPAVPLRRIHGCFLTEEELERVVKYVKAGKDHSKFYQKFPENKFE